MIEQLHHTDCTSWQVGQVIVFDWYDGPRSGLCRLARPEAEFYFSLLDERPTEDDLDDRIYRLHDVPAGTCAGVLAMLAPLGEPGGSRWCPVWLHPDADYLKRARACIDGIIDAAAAAPVVIYSRDMIRIRRCWAVSTHANHIQDWFSHLGL